ncbi:hypothetical protein M378DRAFT_164802 [Amanita muscaria Koide BX008]|uniref:Uncharacterized protein n=1 Tax=Amanita muscaria (strain Koide BX008) TaxID=946122 RepID=A0A0C2X1U0_AMAMK|nr:hypothetical protein M378DRAFT_164802 [Amanita muscaria Koide BX008]
MSRRLLLLGVFPDWHELGGQHAVWVEMTWTVDSLAPMGYMNITSPAGSKDFLRTPAQNEGAWQVLSLE